MTYDLGPVYRTEQNLGKAYETSLAWAKTQRTVDELLKITKDESINEAFRVIHNCESMIMQHEQDLVSSINSVAVAKGLKTGKQRSVGNPSTQYEGEALRRLASLQIVLTLFGAVPEKEIRQDSELYDSFQEAKRLKIQEENHIRRIRFLGEDIGRLLDI